MTLHQQEFYFRGAFMSLFIDIEFLLSDSIAAALAGENEIKLNIMEDINPRLQLEPKISLLNNLIQKRYPAVHAKFKGDLEKMRKFTSLRNSFAHKRIKIEEAKKTLHFIVLDNGKFINNSFPFDDLNTRFDELKKLMINFEVMHKEVIAEQNQGS